MMRLFPEPWGNYLLSEIIETVPPESIPWWPQTLGWKVLFVFLLCYISYQVYRQILRYKRNQYRRDALSWIKQLPEYNEKSTAPVYRQIPALVKQTALTAYGREIVNELTHQEWEQWLDEQCKTSNFCGNCSTIMYQLAYSPNLAISEPKMNSLISEVTNWIECHEVSHD